MTRRNHVNWWTRRTEVPPYEVVGPLERVDERDNVIRRNSLVPGTPAYEAYYAAHPDLEEIDRHCRLHPTKERMYWKQRAVYRKYPLTHGFIGSQGPSKTKVVAESVAPQRVEIDPRLASENVKGVARFLGADLVGICEINPAWVLSYRMRQDGFGEPVELKDRYAIVVAMGLDFNLLLAYRGFSMATDIALLRTEDKLHPLVIRLASYIRNLGYPAKVHSRLTTGEGMEVLPLPLAVDAGLGEVGRATLLITKKFGPAVQLGVITTDMPLAVDKPVDLGMRDFCTKCMKCAECCPTKSISFGEMEAVRGVKQWRFDAESCYRLRMAVGDSHICGICVSVCPWTKPRNMIHETAANMSIYFPFIRRPLVWLDDILYGKKPRQHPLPGWLEPGRRHTLKQRVITALHKI